jgi:hypothetical protein
MSHSQEEAAFLESVAQLLRNSLSPDPSIQRQNLDHFEGLRTNPVPGVHYLARVLSLVLVPDQAAIGVEVPAQDPPIEIGRHGPQAAPGGHVRPGWEHPHLQ